MAGDVIQEENNDRFFLENVALVLLSYISYNGMKK